MNSTISVALQWNKNLIVRLSASLALFIFFNSCHKNNETVEKEPPSLQTITHEVGTKWADMTLYVARYSAFNTPTYCSRALGYVGLCMYESIVQGDPTHRSMSDQLNGLTLPVHNQAEKFTGCSH
jgi:hypothetical protein